jgi:phenylalanine-4-hydroxylase
LTQEVLIYLEKLKGLRPEIAHLIRGGLELIFVEEKVS